jgi:hypothetical protein
MKSQYTIRDWFDNHPNVTFLLLGVWYLWMVAATVSFLADERWGWFVAGVIAAVSAGDAAVRWWRDHL